MNIDTREISLEPADNARLLSLCGPFDDNIKQLERRLGIEINRRDNHFKLTGRPICVNAAADILRSLYVDTAPMRGETQDIEPEQIHLAIKEARVLEQSAESVPDTSSRRARYRSSVASAWFARDWIASVSSMTWREPPE